MQNKARQYNEKPSSIPNIGNDIDGAKRHNFNTYETPEELRKKAAKKQSSKDLKNLLSEYKAKLNVALSVSTESAQDVLKEYEMKKLIASCELFSKIETLTQDSFRSMVLEKAHGDEREIMRKKFNQLCRKIRNIRYIRPIELSKYFEPKTKDQFREVNGHEVTWATASTTFDSDFLKNKVNGVQYGNSLTENERVYVSEKLVESIKILEKYFVIDFSKLGFSYGARGKAGSIAHYQDSKKVLAFNRGWDGALVHELGHAIDYSLGKISASMPWEIRKEYIAKISKHPLLKLNMKYYIKTTEIFARMFEAYVKSKISEATSYMIFLENDSSLPDLNSESLAWFEKAIESLLIGGTK